MENETTATPFARQIFGGLRNSRESRKVSTRGACGESRILARGRSAVTMDEGGQKALGKFVPEGGWKIWVCWMGC